MYDTNKPELFVVKDSALGSPDKGVLRIVYTKDIVDGTIRLPDHLTFSTGGIWISKGYEEIDHKFREGELFILDNYSPQSMGELGYSQDHHDHWSTSAATRPMDVNQMLPVVEASLPDISSGRVSLNRHFPGVPFFIRQSSSIYGPFTADFVDGEVICTPYSHAGLNIPNHFIARVDVYVASEKEVYLTHDRMVKNLAYDGYISSLSHFCQALKSDWKALDYIPDTVGLPEPVETIAIGLDGTCMLLCEEGWREAMCGTLSLYSANGDRLHTIYTASSPEYGKQTFMNKLSEEITDLKRLYPQATYIGVADGAKENWRYLKQHTSAQILDFFHASEYLGGAAEALFPGSKAKRKRWLEDRLHSLKNKRGAAKKILEEIESAELPKKTIALTEKRYKAVTYFTNNHHLMKYQQALKHHWPIGSGVTEAACKTLVKQRLCGSGMRWKSAGAEVLLETRSLIQSKGRWEQLWSDFMSGKMLVDF